ncbi:MAG: putative peptidoglycan glycosyltransferase FtsW [Planctomycetales bacterium]|jgi:cell division protein FtsW|nr:putative peptidoglycan glycosyltransferase FtsW [Planctomycetales bacterium]
MNNVAEFHTAEKILPSHVVSESAERDNLRRLMIGLVAVLICIGVQMVQSASLTSRPSEQDSVFLSKHLTYLAVSLLFGFVASRISTGWLQKNSITLFGGLVFLLTILLVPGIGSRINGAQRWLRFGGLSLQPSELGRIILPLMAATIICNRRAAGFSLSTVPATLMPLLILPLVAIEPDLGATVFLGSGFILALFLGGWPLRYFIGCALLFIPAATSLLILKPYQMERIRGFMAAWQDLSQAPWQVRQSLLSIGSGGLKGTGIGGGWQKLSYLPEANTDFVFAVIGEELGLLGTMTVCFVWVALFLTGRAALKHLPRTSFEWIFGTTLLLQLVLQAMANIAVVTGLVPPKGVPHPFISYGGTNLLVSVTAIGLIIGMSRSRDDQNLEA